MKKLIGKVLDKLNKCIPEITRSINRKVTARNAHWFAITDVRKLKNSPVSGDELAYIRKDLEI